MLTSTSDITLLSFNNCSDRPWLIVAEMFEAKYVATASEFMDGLRFFILAFYLQSKISYSSVSVSCQVNWACNFIVGLVFPYLQESLGAFSFVPFAVVLLMTIIFVVIFLPETKGTTPEELRDEIVRSLSVFLAMSNDTANDGHSSSAGNPIDVEWRRAMDDLRRQEELDMLRGTYSEYLSSQLIWICHFSHSAHFSSSLPQIMDFNPLIPIK